MLRISPMSPILASPMAKWCPVPFIIGPINGGLPFPKEVMYAQKKEREWLSPLRKFHRYLPYAKSSYKSAAAILAGFQHTFDGLPKKSLPQGDQFPEIGYDPALFHPAAEIPSAANSGSSSSGASSLVKPPTRWSRPSPRTRPSASIS